MGLFRRPGKGGDTSKSGLSESQPLTSKTPDADGNEESLPQVDAETTAKAQAVMRDHLTIMRDVVMKIRHQEGYAKAMYANCPRLQHLLDRNPDLRPVFEDPRLVKINFETVYKEAGGILPEDEEEAERKRNNPSLIMRIANHPIFKVLKLLIFFKKVIGCIAGGGIALVAGFWHFCTDCCTDCCCEDAVEQIGEIDEDIDSVDENEYGLDPDAALDENQVALNTAADYMEDPEVQEHMQRLLEDPENLEDAIENDAELRALRDSNPLCAELMTDTETMKILTDPDNLRALGEAPQMIELDFSDPTGFSPEADFIDVENGNLEGLDAVNGGDDFLDASGSMDGLEAYDADYDENDIMFEMEDDPNDLADGIEEDSLASFNDEPLPEDGELGDEIEWGEVDDAEAGEGEFEMDALELEEPEMDTLEPEPETEATKTSNWEDDLELEQQEIDPDANAATKSKGKPREQNQEINVEGAKKGGMTGMIASFGVAATEVIASQIVGEIFGSDMIPTDLLGGDTNVGPDLGGLENTDDVAGIAEDTVDDVDDEKDSKKASTQKMEARYSVYDDGRKSYVGLLDVSAAAAALAEMGDLSDEEDDSIDDGLESINSKESASRSEESFNDEEEANKSKRSSRKVFGAFKSLASATVTAAKEHIVGAVVGGDFAEMLVEKQEESSSDSSDNDDDDDKKKKQKKPSSRRRFGLFGSKSSKNGDNHDEAEEEYDPDFYKDNPGFRRFSANGDEEEYVDPTTTTNNNNAYAPEYNFAANEDEEEGLTKQQEGTAKPPPSTKRGTKLKGRFFGRKNNSANGNNNNDNTSGNSFNVEEELLESFRVDDDDDDDDEAAEMMYDGNAYSMNFSFDANEDDEEYDPNFRNNHEDDLEKGGEALPKPKTGRFSRRR